MEDFIHMIVAVLLFLMALSACFTGFTRLTEVMASNAFVIEDSVVFEGRNQERTMYVERSQLAAMLLQNANIGVQVSFADGTSIEIAPDGVNMETVQRICQADAAGYKKVYNYDEQGVIQRLTLIQIKKE